MPRPLGAKPGRAPKDNAGASDEADFPKPVQGASGNQSPPPKQGWTKDDDGTPGKGAYPEVPSDGYAAASTSDAGAGSSKQVAQLQQQVQGLQKDVATLKGELAQGQKHYADVYAAWQKAEEGCKARALEVDNLNAAVKQQEDRVARRQQQVDQLNLQINPLQQQVQQLQQQLREKESALVKAQQAAEAASMAAAMAESKAEAKDRELKEVERRAAEQWQARLDAANREAEARYQALSGQLASERAEADRKLAAERAEGDRRVAEERQAAEQVKQRYAALEDKHGKLDKEYTDFKSMFKVHVDLSKTGVYDTLYSKDALRSVLDNVLQPNVDEAARKYQEAFPSLSFAYPWVDMTDMNDKKRAMLVRRMLKHVLYCLLDTQLWGVPSADASDVRCKLMPPSTDTLIALFNPRDSGGDAYLNKVYDVQRERARTMLGRLKEGKADREVAQLASSLHAHLSSLLTSGGGDLIALARGMRHGDRLPPASAPSGSETEAAMVELLKAAAQAQLMAWSVHPELHLLLLGFHRQDGKGVNGLAVLSPEQERMVEVRSEYKAAANAGVDGRLVLSCDVPAACYTLEPGRVKLGPGDSQVVCMGGVYVLAHC